MKRLLSLLLAFSIVGGALAACNTDDTDETGDTTVTTEATTGDESEEPTTDGGADPTETTGEEPKETDTTETTSDVTDGDTALTGLGIVFSNGNSRDWNEDRGGEVNTQAYAAAVLVDEDGRIVDVSIDALQSRFPFNEEGVIDVTPDTAFITKQVLGDEYNMRPASPIGREWFEQADDFEEFVIGMTAEEVAGIAEDDADLVASVTVTLSLFQDIVIEAIEKAEDLGASTSDSVGLGIVGGVTQTKTEGDDNGPAVAVAYNTYAAASYDDAAVITSLVIDASQARFEVNDDGTIGTDLATDFQTKSELGEDYNMRGASPIGKEWFEQAVSFQEYATGKSLADVLGMDLKEDSAPADEDLASSVTIDISGFLGALEGSAVQAGVTSQPDGPSTGAPLKTGFGITWSNGNSRDASEDSDGAVDTQAYVAAVLVDDDGRIVRASIDALQSRFSFDADGVIATDPDTVFDSKKVRGDDYNMRPASPIGREWDEQAQAFAEWLVGKNADEIAAATPEDADLASTVTVTLSTFQTIAIEAIESAEHLGASEGDYIGLGVTGSASQTKQEADDDGPAQTVAYNYYSVVSFDDEGVITSSIMDASQARFVINDDGTIETPLDTDFQTKNELGDDYGMRPASPIGAEFNEQSLAFSEYVVGLTANEVQDIAVTEGKPSEDDLTSSVTITITGFQEAVALAGQDALAWSRLDSRGEPAKIGLGVVFSAGNSRDADGDTQGVVDTQAYAAAVLVDHEGRVTAASIDALQSRFEFDDSGVITTPLDTTYTSKQLLGDDYGMRAASSIGKEWNEQADAFAAWVVGKTADEILNADPDDEDLASTVTASVTTFQKVVIEAIENAEFSDARTGDYIGLGIVGRASASRAEADDRGPATAQADNHYAALSFDRAGTVTAAIIDATQAKYELNESGEITTDLAADFLSKYELGDDYGMRPASPIEAEWDEQADFFSNYIIGLTADEVLAFDLDDGTPTDSDLTAGVTIIVTDFLGAVEIAGEDALAAAWEDAEGGESAKTGFGLYFSNGNSKDADGDTDGVVDTQAYTAAVLVDGEGRIADVSIDALQSRFPFDAEGVITATPDTTFVSKQVLGDDYGMRPASPIGKELNEQADAFEEFVMGMTAEEVAGIAEDDADLTASVTVTLSTFQNIVIDAMENAQDLGASTSDKIGIGVVGSAGQTKQEGDDNGPATAVAYNTYAAITFDDEGTITSIIIDASQAKFQVNDDGTIETALDSDFETKYELGDDYNMRGASPIGAEWFEQADSFTEWATGKTVDDVLNVTVDDTSTPTDEDLASGVTIVISDILGAVDAAAIQAGVN